MARALIPWVALGLVALMLAAAAFPEPAALEYDVRLVAAEPWRLLTSQLVHWSPAMLAADVLLAGIAGAIVERRSRRLAVLAIVLGAAASAVAVGASGLARYRGSSGIGTALLVAGGLELSVRGASRPVRVAGLCALVLGAVKIALERSGRSPLLPEGVASATAVHVAGVAAGAAAFLATTLRSTPRGIRPP